MSLVAYKDILKTRAENIDFQKDPIKEWVEELTQAMIENNGVGIAGPQIGINKQIAIVKNDPINIVLLNPNIILRAQGYYRNKEGCLTIPGEIYKVARYKSIVYENHTKTGTSYTMSTNNKKLSACIQHEIDHLNGLCIKDKGKKYDI